MPQPGLRGEQGLCGQAPGLADIFPPTVPVTAAHGAGDGRSAPAVRASTAHRSSCQPVPSLLRWFCWHGGGGPAGAWMPGAGVGLPGSWGSLPFSEKLRHQFRFRGRTEKRKSASLWQLPAVSGLSQPLPSWQPGRAAARSAGPEGRDPMLPAPGQGRRRLAGSGGTGAGAGCRQGGSALRTSVRPRGESCGNGCCSEPGPAVLKEPQPGTEHGAAGPGGAGSLPLSHPPTAQAQGHRAACTWE